MSSSSSSLLQQSDPFFSERVLSRQSTAGHHSSRIYYRGTEGIPFQWEQQPGKPIIIEPPQEINNPLPPLSPPPAAILLNTRFESTSTTPRHHHHNNQFSAVWSKVPSTSSSSSVWKRLVKKREKLYEIRELMMEKLRKRTTHRRDVVVNSRRKSISGPVEYVARTSTLNAEEDGGSNHFWRFDGETMRVMPRNSSSDCHLSNYDDQYSSTTTTTTTTATTNSGSVNSLSQSSSINSLSMNRAPVAVRSKYDDDEEDDDDDHHHPGLTCSPWHFRSPIVFRVVKRV